MSTPTPPSTPSPRPLLTPWRALLDPVWLGALGMLVLNDHILKALSLGALTGKLSDIAGLFLAPALLATLCMASSRRVFWGGAILVGAVFSAINLSPQLALLWDAAMSSMLLPFHTTPDPTDLLMLPALALGGWRALVFTKRPLASSKKPRALGIAALAALACSASGVNSNSQHVEPSEFQGTVTIFNKTNEVHQLEIYSLSEEITLDCDAVSSNPGAMLRNELFEDFRSPFLIPLFSGEEVAVNPGDWTQNWNTSSRTGDCQAFLVRSQNLADILVFWRTGTVNFKRYFHNKDAPQELEPAPQTIVIEADYTQVIDQDSLHEWRGTRCPLPETEWDIEIEWDNCWDMENGVMEEAARVPAGTRYSWRSINRELALHFERSRFDMGSGLPTPARCRTAGAGEGIEWEAPQLLTSTPVLGLEQGLDGCHTFRFPGQRSWLVCAPWEAISKLSPQLTPAGESRLSISLIDLTDQFQLQRGIRIKVDRDEQGVNFRHMDLVVGEASEVLAAADWEQELRTGCEPSAEACGAVSLPIDLRFNTTGGRLLVEEGERVEVGLGRAFYLARSFYAPVRNLACEMEASQSGLNIEGVWVYD